MSIRPQYHFRDSDNGLLAWDVSKLITKSAGLPTFQMKLEDIRELDEPYWHTQNSPLTPRAVANHAKLIHQCDLTFPIILCCEGRLMDGMHRVCKAWLQGLTLIDAVQFPEYLAPDYIGNTPEQLPY